MLRTGISLRDRWTASSRQTRTFLREPAVVLVTLGIAAALVIFVLWPIAAVLSRSFADEHGAFTLANYARFFSRSYFYGAFTNSLILGVVTTTLVLFFGFAVAYVVTDLRPVGSDLLNVLARLPLVAPPFIFALALIIIGGRRGLIVSTLGVEVRLYGWPGLIIAQTISFLPLGFMMIQNVLLSLGQNLKDAGYTLGAREPRVLRTVVIPLAAPGIVKAALLIFIMSIADFGTPTILGGGMNILASEAYLQVVGEYNTPMASVLCVFLLLPSLAGYAIHKYALHGKGFVTMSSATVKGERWPAPRALRYPFVFFAWLIVAIIIVTFAVILIGAFVKTIPIDFTFTLANFRHKLGLAALKNSLQYTLLAAFIGSVIGTMLAYLLVRLRFMGQNILEFISLLGFAIPGTVLGLGYVLVFNRQPLLLSGTAWIIILNIAFHNLPVGLQAGMAKLNQIDPAIDEASLSLGARTLATFWRVTLPLMSSSFWVGFLYTFMAGMVTVSAVVFLMSPETTVASVYILLLAETGHIGTACALAVMLMASVAGALGLLRLVSSVTHTPGADRN